LKGIALAPGRDGALWPCGEIFAADEQTIAVFELLGLDIPFLQPEAEFERLAQLCPTFNAAAAIEALEAASESHLRTLFWQSRQPLQCLFTWLEQHRTDVLSDTGLKARLVALPIFPSHGGLQSLDSLALPGGFSDPLELAELVDLAALNDRREFLRDLGMPELNFVTYAETHLPKALNDPAVSPERRRAALILLADHVGELKDNERARKALSEVPLVECTDGAFRPAEECYFESQEVRDTLGPKVNLAILATGHDAAIRDMLEWLGVAAEPRISDVVERVLVLTVSPYSVVAAQQVKVIVAHLAKRVDAQGTVDALRLLKTKSWLPARSKSDRWYAPNELYASYQDYLFQSQAYFIDLPATVQHAASKLLEVLGVGIAPPVGLVVKHLIHCIHESTSVHNEVYRFLNQHADEPAVQSLRGMPCLWLGDIYRSPTQVFWSEHPFGRYRWRLHDDLRAYGKLLGLLGVAEAASANDALAVVKEIAGEFGSVNKALDEEAYSVLMACWRMLDQAQSENCAVMAQVEGLRGVKCVPKLSKVLNPPEVMFFETRAGLAAKFGNFLTGNVIQKPFDAGKALSLAGVRALGTAVEVELLECSDPVDAPEISERMGNRRNHIGRVLEAQANGQTVGGALDRLATIKYVWATHIRIRYRLNVFDRQLYSDEEQVPALFEPDAASLFVARSGQEPSWAPIARELAIALLPEEDPGRMAAGLKEALTPATAEEAARLLDELGFLRVDTEVQAPPATGPTQGSLGANDLDGGETQVGAEVLTTEEALRQLLGENASTPSAPVQDLTAGPGQRDQGSTGGGAAPANHGTRRPVLRSYVPSPDQYEDHGEAHAGTSNGGRSPVDIAGVKHVLAHETASGRFPTEMAHNNPGYDIESRDASGEVTRYIEVKSLSGDWRATYAVLSESQFNKGRELGDRFWLYVVERAEASTFTIHCIQNPAVRANHFMFDDGWSTVAEGGAKPTIGNAPHGED
jgi:hypothetical protein